MLKKRLIPVLFLKHGWLVRSEKFSIHQNLGNPVAQVERYNTWDVDELIYIDITPDDVYDTKRDDLGGGAENPSSIIDIIKLVSKKCFMPLTFGGKIRTIDDIRLRLNNGADKVTINTIALENPEFVFSAAKEFGSQAIVVSIDVKINASGQYEVYSDSGKTPTGYTPEKWALLAQDSGAGEIFLNSIDRDGMANGYDLQLIKSVVDITSIPVIACGGVGNYKDFERVLADSNVSAVAAGNIFHFKEMAYPIAKRQLKKMKFEVR